MNEPALATEPVLVVHGIGVRDQRGFNSRVQQLAAGIGPKYTLIPVHWAELAASTLHLEKITAAKPSLEPKPPIREQAEPGSWWGGMISGLGQAIEGGTQAADEGLRGLLRTGISENIVPYLGDILVYQGIREPFHGKVRSYVPDGYGTIDRPIKAIGHSLGGVMLFDLAVATGTSPLWFSHLITMGSQPSFFHLQHRRSEAVKEFTGEPVVLPPMIQAWTNVLDDDDWLSFAVAPIFRLSSGRRPSDHWVDNTDGTYTNLFTLTAHGAYWANPVVHAIIREALAT